MLKKIKNPILFQGHLKKKKYFEGWYYKFVSKDLQHSLALIPGISLNQKDSHCFIQIFYTNAQKQMHTEYIRYQTHDFDVIQQPFTLKINNHIFDENHIEVNINNDKIKINGKLEIKGLNKINKSFISPSIMGPFAYLRFMECHHGVVSMSHEIKGQMTINQVKIDFSGGKGYIEKDWGRSFPQSYVWMQSNHFSNQQLSFMFSEASIPFLGFEFKGLLVILMDGQNEYRFTTYNFSKIIERDIRKHEVFYQVKKGKYMIEIQAKNKETIGLAAPKNGVMDQVIKEGLTGSIDIKLYKNNILILEDTGHQAGIEIMMDQTIN